MKSYWSILVLCLGFIFLGYWADRSDFSVLISVFSILFVFYIFLIRNKKFKVKYIIGLGILFRLIFLFSTPILSDDYFRFIYDGRILTSGNNPYLVMPNEANESELIVNLELNKKVYNGLNSKQYYSVYPPINQVLFGTSTLLGFNKIKNEIVLMRLLIILFELGVLFLMLKLLKHYNQDLSKLSFYAFNPLVIIELTGNLHFEGVMLFFGCLAVWLWITNKKMLSPVALSLAIGVKLLPLMVLPILLRQVKFKHALLYGTVVLILVGLCFVPFINKELITNFTSSIDLYFRSFEFNASIFYIVKSIGYSFVGYDIIQKAGPIIGIIVFITIIIISIQNKFFMKTVFEKALIIFTIYLLAATTVHPWYITTLVGLSVLTNIKYPIVWSYLVFLSYSHYQGGTFVENYTFIILEYTLLLVVIFYEINKFRISKNNLVKSLE